MEFNYDVKLSTHLLFIVKEYENANQKYRFKLGWMFNVYLRHYFYEGVISEDDFIMYQSLYYNLINRRNGEVSRFVREGYYPGCLKKYKIQEYFRKGWKKGYLLRELYFNKLEDAYAYYDSVFVYKDYSLNPTVWEYDECRYVRIRG